MAQTKFCNTVKVGEKGQIVIPKEIRDLLGINSGDSLLILADQERGIAIPRKADMEKIMEEIMSYEKR